MKLQRAGVKLNKRNFHIYPYMPGAKKLYGRSNIRTKGRCPLDSKYSIYVIIDRRYTRNKQITVYYYTSDTSVYGHTYVISNK